MDTEHKLEQEVFEYLDTLHKMRPHNMYDLQGADLYIRDKFGVSKDIANELLERWTERKPEG